MPDERKTISEGQDRRLAEMMRWYENVGRHLRPSDKPVEIDASPVETYIAKANTTISGSCNGDFTVWGTSLGSTAVPTGRGSTLNARDWCDDGFATDDKAVLVRGAGRLYAIPCGGQDTKTYGYNLVLATSGQVVFQQPAGTGESAIWDAPSSLHPTTDAETGVSLGSSAEEITFTKGGTYHYSHFVRTEDQIASTRSSETANTISVILQRSTGSTVFLTVTGSEIRYTHLPRWGSIVYGDGSPELTGERSGVVVVSSGHIIRQRRYLQVGTTDSNIHLSDASLSLVRLDNSITYATS